MMASKGRGFREVDCGGYRILVGKGDEENDRLTFGVAEPRDLWLHVSGPAGSHVVVRNPEGLELAAVPRAVVERAAELAAWHSKARGARGKVEVHVCRVADVRKPRGFAAGQVLLKRWESVKVYPRGFDEPETDEAPDPAALPSQRRPRR
jgi:predicted ribosome quality control (RQC) complex YloA/Tae2 family protein